MFYREIKFEEEIMYLRKYEVGTFLNHLFT